MRRVARRLPPRVRTLGAKVLAWGRSAEPPALVSVIVPVYNVEEYLDECLDSVRSQAHSRLEILVVNDGSPDDSPAIAARHALEDPRIRVLDQANAGLGAARNTGARQATGDYLCFVDSDDLLPTSAVSDMVRSAEESGSDVVVGVLSRFNSTGRWQPDWSTDLHSHRRVGIRVTELPGLVRNNYSCGKLFRSTFWRNCGLWFREGVAYEDQPLVTQLYIRASKIDVLPTVTYEWRQRSDRSSISQQTASLQDLADRVAAWDISHQVLSSEAPPAVYDAWLTTLYTTHFHWYLNSSSTTDDEYWTLLQQAVSRLTSSTRVELLDRVEPQHRVAVELTRRDLRAELLEFTRDEGYVLQRFPAELKPGGLEFQLPTFRDPDVAIPDAMYYLTDKQIPFVHRLDRAHWTGNGDLRIAGWAYFRYIDLNQHETQITVSLTHVRTGQQLNVIAREDVAHTLLPPTDDRWANYAPAAFVADMPFAELLTQCNPREDDVWTLSLTVETDRLGRTASAPRVLGGGSARFLPPLRTDGALIHLPGHRVKGQFTLHYWKAQVVLEDVGLEGCELTGRLDAADTTIQSVDLEHLGSPQEGGTAIAATEDEHVSMSLPSNLLTHAAAADTPTRWSMRAQLASGARVPVATSRSHVGATYSRVGSTVLAVRQSHRGVVLLQATPPITLIDSVRITDRAVDVSGHVPAISDGTLTLGFTGSKAWSRPVTAQLKDGTFSVSVPLTYIAWRFGEHTLPSANYTLRFTLDLPDSARFEGDARVSEQLNTRLPLSLDGDRIAGTVLGGTAMPLRLQLSPPVGHRARGMARRNQLEQSCNARGATGPLHGLLIETNFGEIAGCSGAAVHHELRRRGADIPVYWAVKDYSVPVPEGGIPVVRNSSEWFDVLASAKYFIENMYQPLYHEKPDDQVIIATFHGYPFKQMGHPHWENLQLPRRRIEAYIRRTQEWNYLVSPARYATPLLQENFRYDGPVLEIGYPRNDILQASNAPAIRSATRKSLGIGDDVTAVLYAPTFRDYLAVNDNRASMPDFLDAEALSRMLGDDYVVLIRGHAFNARTQQRQAASTHIIDVTDYPDPADLYLASDAAVLDYSSLRFDYGVTGKPMLFLVPDLHRYRDSRGWLFNFEPTAPGPLLSTTAEVASALMRLDSVAADYREAYASFRESYLDLEDGKAAARLVDAVFVPRGDAAQRS